jgi:hypothetical protein
METLQSAYSSSGCYFFSTNPFSLLRNDGNMVMENVFFQLQLEELDINKCVHIACIFSHLSFWSKEGLFVFLAGHCHPLS